MKFIERRMSYSIVENNGKYFVMSRDPKENKQFESESEAQKYFEQITNWILTAQANAPSWD